MLTRMLCLGGARVDVVERRPERLRVAPAFGADRTATSTDQLDRERGRGVVVDATGNASAIQEGLSLVRRAGTFAVFGVSHAAAKVEISPYDIFKRELTIVGSNSVRHSFGLLEVLAGGRLPGGELLDEPVPLADIATALRRTRDASGLKATVLPGTA